eukprot:205520-Pelagomonas_calceolata.AAC.2
MPKQCNVRKEREGLHGCACLQEQRAEAKVAPLTKTFHVRMAQWSRPISSSSGALISEYFPTTA